MNACEMDSGYPDSVNSSPGSRENDPDQRWEAHDSVSGGSRVRLMCSYGGKIQQRSHDNQLSYVGGDTRILAVDRNIRFASMIGKLSSLWGSSVSFKYQLPNEDLDALVSVTNDEDMENMMAEYDRLQKTGYRSSRLRLFVFSNRSDGTSSQSSLSLMEETKPENWFVNALNVGPVSRSETSPQGPWNSGTPDYLFGLGGNGVEDDRNSAQRGYAGHETNSKDQEVYMGRELRLPEIHSARNYPTSAHSSIDSTASAPARMNTSGPPHGCNQAEMGINLGRGVEFDRNLPANSKPVDSSTVSEIGARKAADRTANTGVQKQEQHTSEFSVVTSSPINERAPQQPQLQVPIQEFQKLHLKQPQDKVAWPVDANANLNTPCRKVYSDPERAVNFSNPDMTRLDPTPDQPYMPQERQNQQSPSPSEYYIQDQRSHFVQQGYQQMQDPHGDHLSAYHPVYFMHQGSPGQPAAGGGGVYYNTVQTVTSPVQVYSPEAASASNPVTTVRAAATVQRQAGSDPTEPYSQIPAPVHKGPYTPVPSGPGSSDVRVVYRPTAPVPHGHTDPYSYQNAVYEPSSRQVYYTQAPQVMNPQYQFTTAGNVTALDFHDAPSSEIS